ncbi:MAG: hypothetical protein KTR20_12775 [Cellvibrionaceae bacterium]|nr:hypothetical protein [Cellvibrionaceae bacterium]
MRLGKKQELFSRLLVKLMAYAFDCGYEMRLGHALRCQNCPVGRKTSCHKLKLAQDINLFLDGVYLSNTADHQRLGEYWESLHPLCRWGGRFGDGNHYSLEHKGRQ